MAEYLQRILNTQVYDVVIETPLDPVPRSSARIDNRVLLKSGPTSPAADLFLQAGRRVPQTRATERASEVINTDVIYQ